MQEEAALLLTCRRALLPTKGQSLLAKRQPVGAETICFLNS
jgi:hypothetical protein